MAELILRVDLRPIVSRYRCKVTFHTLESQTYAGLLLKQARRGRASVEIQTGFSLFELANNTGTWDVIG